MEKVQWTPLLEYLPKERHGLPETVTMHTLAQYILEQLPENLPRKPCTTQYYCWMCRNGLMEKITFSTQRSWKPTKAGEQLGILPGNQSLTSQLTPPAQQYILDNLGRIVQDLGSGEAYWKKRFVMTETIRKQIPCADGTFTKHFEDAINSALLSSGYDAMPRGLLYLWLRREAGLYQYSTSDGNTCIILSEKGRRIGLSVDNGRYIRLSETARRFVVDNLEKILDYGDDQ